MLFAELYFGLFAFFLLLQVEFGLDAVFFRFQDGCHNGVVAEFVKIAALVMRLGPEQAGFDELVEQFLADAVKLSDLAFVKAEPPHVFLLDQALLDEFARADYIGLVGQALNLPLVVGTVNGVEVADVFFFDLCKPLVDHELRFDVLTEYLQLKRLDRFRAPLGQVVEHIVEGLVLVVETG